jgi:hypothetical protein
VAHGAVQIHGPLTSDKQVGGEKNLGRDMRAGNRTLEDRYDFGVFVPCIMSCCLAYRVLGTPILTSKNQIPSAW